MIPLIFVVDIINLSCEVFLRAASSVTFDSSIAT